jgi:hypothetical protein
MPASLAVEEVEVVAAGFILNLGYNKVPRSTARFKPWKAHFHISSIRLSYTRVSSASNSLPK